VGGDPVDHELVAHGAAMDEHQLAVALTGVLVPSVLGGQPKRLHCRPAARQPIAGDPPIQVARPQAVGAVISILHSGDRRLACHIHSAVAAAESLLARTSAAAASVCLTISSAA